MGEGVPPDDRLVVLDRVTREPAHQTAGAGQLLGADAAVDAAEVVGPGADGHHDLFQGGVAGALADAVDGALDLAGTALHGRQRVGHGEAEVVVAVGGDHVVAAHPGTHVVQALGVLLGDAEADGVGDVQGGGAVVDRDLQHLAHELEIGTRRVLRRELDVLGVAAGPGDCCGRLGLHLVRGHAQLVLHVRLAGRDEDVDAATGGGLDGLPAAVDVTEGGARQAADHRALDPLGDGLHGLEVALAGDREAGLDDVDTEAGQLLGDLQLLALVERDAR